MDGFKVLKRRMIEERKEGECNTMLWGVGVKEE